MSVVLAENPRERIGMNNPPIAERLAIDHADLLEEVERLAARANEAPRRIASETDAEIVKQVNRDAAALWKKVDGVREVEKEPFLRGGNEVQAFFKPALDRADKIKKFFQGVADDHARTVAAEERRRRDEEARKLREEADRQREIAERAAAAERPTVASKAEVKAEEAIERAERLEVAPVALDGAKTEWAYRIVNVDAIDLNALRSFIPVEVVEKAIRQHMRIHKGSRPIAGVEFHEQVKAVLR